MGTNSLTLAFPWAPAAGDRVLLTSPDGTTVSYGSAEILFEAQPGTPGEIAAEARLLGVTVALSREASGLLSALGLGSASAFTVGELGIGWRDGEVRLTGGGGLALAAPVNASLGPLTARTFHARLELDAGISLETSLDVTFELAGGITVSLERVGVRTALTGFDLSAGIPVALEAHPPVGGGLDLDLGIVTGGGFLSVDEVAGQYASVFAARMLGVGVNATALVNTKPAFSMLAVLSAEFRPVGIDLSFGFTLNAVGGLIGLNRCCDAHQLREGVHTGAIDSLMFPQDPIRNAPRIIADLGRFFPPSDGDVVIAPMLELGWGKPTGMIALRLALITQASDPLVQIAGTLNIELPPGLGANALIRIHAAFLGSVDPGRNLISFDASLIESHLLFATIEGDLALRFRYAGNADFLVSAGGFFPRWEPPGDLSLGTLRRLAVSIGSLGPVRMRMESYFAVTSNTVQHGAWMEMSLGVDGYGVSGSLGYDVIVVFDPFGFRADVGASFKIEAFGATLCSVDITGELTGPHPLHLTARGSFKVLFARISVPIDVTFGDGGEVPPRSVTVLDALKDTLRRPGIAVPETPHGNLADVIRFRDGIVRDSTLIQPDSVVVVKQDIVPLATAVDRVGGARPTDGRVFEIAKPRAGGKNLPTAERPTGSFAPAQFFDLTQDQKLSRRAFVDYPAGLRIGGDGLPDLSGLSLADFDTEAILIDSEGKSHPFLSFQFATEVNGVLLAGGGAAQAKRTQRLEPGGICERAEQFVLVNVDTGQTLTGRAAAQETHAALAKHLATQPALRDSLRVISALDLDA